MTRTGADLLAATLVRNGINTCFANPGTTEMHLLAALGREESMTMHLCLFEGVATGAADGYARMTGKPAATLLHLGPGFANGMANLHNARKAGSPVFNIVGEHATYHLDLDAPLTADIEGMAQTVSAFVATPRRADDMAMQTADVLSAIAGSGVGTLIVPNDAAWGKTDAGPRAMAPPPAAVFDKGALDAASKALRAPGGTLIIGAACITRRMVAFAHAIGVATGCSVFCEAAVARMERGGGTPPLARVPFHVDPATETLKDTTTAVLAGALAPVAFFAYPGRPSLLLPEGSRTITLAPQGGDTEAALAALAETLGAKVAPDHDGQTPNYDPEAVIDAETLGRVVAAHLPKHTIVVDEAITNGAPMFAHCSHAPAHDWLNNRGGSIGYSTPVAIGAAVACPNRKVLCVTGDGSAFYTLQSLWTMARERLDITVLILANRSYRILANESAKIGAGEPTGNTMPLMSLEDPAPDWVKLAEGHGVAACSVDTAGALAKAFCAALNTSGPRLIEVRM